MCRFCTSSPCVTSRPAAAISVPRVKLVCATRGRGGGGQGTSYRVGTRGSGVHGSLFGDQQTSVLCGSWWRLIPVNRTHRGFRSTPWGCEPLSPPLLCPQMVHPCWLSQRSGGTSETEVGAWQTPQGRGSQELTMHPLSSVGETCGLRVPLRGSCHLGRGRRWHESGFLSSAYLRWFCSLGWQKLSAVPLISREGGPVHGWL